MSSNMSVVFVIIAIIMTAVLVVLNGIFAKRFKEYIEPLDKKEFPLKSFIPAALGLLEALRIGGSGRYQAWLHQKIVMVYGNRYSHFHMKIHWANKLLYAILGIILAAFLGLTGDADVEWLMFIPAAGILLFFLADKTLEDKYKAKKLSLEKDFPDFISKLILLVNAGLTVRQAIERIVADNSQKGPIYQELYTTLTDIQAGLHEQEAYSDLAERCKVKEITNFVGILQQNLKLGGGQMLYELKKLGSDCWEMRKNVAKQLGETASSKLMFPLAIMFLAIILICIAPAIMNFRGAF